MSVVPEDKQVYKGAKSVRKVRDTLRSSMSAESFESHLAGLQETLWPDGVWRKSAEARTEVEKHDTRLNAGKNLGLLIPGRLFVPIVSNK